jgi:hypothetical protein
LFRRDLQVARQILADVDQLDPSCGLNTEAVYQWLCVELPRLMLTAEITHEFEQSHTPQVMWERLIGECATAHNVLNLHGSTDRTLTPDAPTLRAVKQIAREIVKAGHAQSVPPEVGEDQRTVPDAFRLLDVLRRWIAEHWRPGLSDADREAIEAAALDAETVRDYCRERYHDEHRLDRLRRDFGLADGASLAELAEAICRHQGLRGSAPTSPQPAQQPGGAATAPPPRKRRGRRKNGSASKRWLTVSQAAKIAGCECWKISRWATEGKFKTNGKARTQRRIHPDDFNRFLLSHRDRAETDASVERKLQKAQQPRK